MAQGWQLTRCWTAGHVNVAPRHLTAEAETLLSATLIHEVIHVLGFDPHAFAHFRDERKRRRNKVWTLGRDSATYLYFPSLFRLWQD